MIKKLTLDELREMGPGQLIKNGKGCIPDLWRNGDLKWIAVKGKTETWTIYYGPTPYVYQNIIKFGGKIFDEKIIRKLVPCTDEAWEMYRF